MVLTLTIVGAGVVLLFVLGLFEDKAEEEEQYAGVEQAILGATGAVAGQVLEGFTAASRQVYIDACLSETGIDISETSQDELELVMDALYDIAEALPEGERVSADWMCCASACQLEWQARDGTLDKFWDFWEGLGMGFWEDINWMLNTQGVATECLVNEWGIKAAEKAEEWLDKAKAWVSDLDLF